MLTIRQATETDLEEVLKLYVQPDMDHGNVISLEQAKSIYCKMKQYPDYRIYIAEQGNAVVGTFSLLIMDSMVHMGSSFGVIESVVVSDRHQRHWIGKRMMEYAMELCRQKGCYKAMLSSGLKREGAHRFYESLGFEKHGYSFLMEV